MSAVQPIVAEKIFMLRDAVEGAAAEREATMRLIHRWADEADAHTESKLATKLRYISESIRLGYHLRPLTDVRVSVSRETQG